MATILAKRLGGKVQIKKILAILSTPLQYSCLGTPMDKRSLVGYSPWCCKESDTT